MRRTARSRGVVRVVGVVDAEAEDVVEVDVEVELDAVDEGYWGRSWPVSLLRARKTPVVKAAWM